MSYNKPAGGLGLLDPDTHVNPGSHALHVVSPPNEYVPTGQMFGSRNKIHNTNKNTHIQK